MKCTVIIPDLFTKNIILNILLDSNFIIITISDLYKNMSKSDHFVNTYVSRFAK